MTDKSKKPKKPTIVIERELTMMVRLPLTDDPTELTDCSGYLVYDEHSKQIVFDPKGGWLDRQDLKHVIDLIDQVELSGEKPQYPRDGS